MSTWILQIPHRHPKNKKPMMNSSPGSIKIATSWLVQSSAIQKIIWPLASNTVDAELEKTPVGLVCPATLLLAPQSMNLESFINVGTMPGLTHGIQLSHSSRCPNHSSQGKNHGTISGRRLWSGKTIMIVDELGMIDLQNFYLMNRHCNLARSLDKDSTEFWGGLPIVIFLGDLYQFPPVQGLPLWKQPGKNNNNEVYAHFLWRQFNQVIILDEQMRQSADPAFREFLSRARVGMKI